MKSTQFGCENSKNITYQSDNNVTKNNKGRKLTGFRPLFLINFVKKGLLLTS